MEIPHQYRRCRVGTLTGWICGGDDRFATIAVDGGKYLSNVPWAEVKLLDEYYTGPTGVEVN